ncbi:MAG: tRNA (adenosine(37)-N6)-threonylcarbamoyltransferase complex transferase subunit TsaD [Nitrospira sp.]|nr:tRNA (adenosine(37)-N6)-threonylcarbamoyltransferase complex transferase subunit TsaD [Nitrospira sp.]
MNVLNQATPTPTILGLETSCDETAAAVICGDGRITSSVLYSQHEVHGRYGGVVPELAARRHIETVEAIVSEAMRKASVGWADLHAVAVTRGPGLAGALLVGVSFGKALAYAAGIPLIGVNHLEGHVASAWIDQPDVPFPCVVLVVSGGHTHLYLAHQDNSYELIGQTLDDAAGEAFDKAAKMLQLGYPGGPAVDRAARSGDAGAVRFPRPYRKQRGNFDFSFSGIKTALLYYLRDLDRSGQPRQVADIAAGFQEAIVEVLVEKAFDAVRSHRVSALAVVGGVSANTRLRALLSARAASSGIRLALPASAYCTDNAAMIAAAGRRAYLQGRFASWEMEAEADLAIPLRDTRPPNRSRHRSGGAPPIAASLRRG